MQPRSAQMSERFEPGIIKGVVVRDLRKIPDKRGWLTELFRSDELEAEFYPAMAYISSSSPGVTRGPHEHLDQADLFCFIGPSNFELRLWDNREESESFNNVMTIVAGEDYPQSILIPPRIVHAYRNVGTVPGIVINCPNRLYAGAGRREKVDEVRHEDDPETIFRME
jgi:dTDP-4-dehydrorhamnose 3,5-epimerase